MYSKYDDDPSANPAASDPRSPDYDPRYDPRYTDYYNDRYHGGTRYDDQPLRPEDEYWERPKKQYADNEKELFIYGVPGSDDYKTDLTEDEIAELEILWEYHYTFSILRGVL